MQASATRCLTCLYQSSTDCDATHIENQSTCHLHAVSACFSVGRCARTSVKTRDGKAHHADRPEAGCSDCGMHAIPSKDCTAGSVKMTFRTVSSHRMSKPVRWTGGRAASAGLTRQCSATQQKTEATDSLAFAGSEMQHAISLCLRASANQRPRENAHSCKPSC